MYEPYPGSAPRPEVQRPPVPVSVANAVKLMYAGAVVSLIGIVIDLTTLSATKSALARRSPSLTASQLDAAQNALIAGSLISGVIAATLWIIIARACGRGQNWARITGTVFFLIATVEALGSLAAPEALLVKVLWFVTWLIGLGAVVFLWQSSSSAFFKKTQP
jgi:hypothetical protein